MARFLSRGRKEERKEERKKGRKDRVTDHLDGGGYTIRFIITRDRNSPRRNTISDNRVGNFVSSRCIVRISSNSDSPTSNFEKIRRGGARK